MKKKEKYSEDFTKNYYTAEEAEMLLTGYNETNVKNPNTVNEVAQKLTCILTCVRERASGKIFIYNKIDNHYDYAPSWILKSLFKTVISHTDIPWKKTIEDDILGGFDRNIVNTIAEFNYSNSINLSNGVYDLDDKELYPHNPKYSIFDNTLDYAFDKDADCPKFKQFLYQIFDGDEERINLVQEMLGYFLSNSKKGEVCFFFFGGGSNGKSVLASVISHLVGSSNTCAIPLSSMGGKFALQGIIGKRLNISTENGNIGNVEMLKALVSPNDVMNIPVKYKDDYVGIPMAKHVFVMNSLPETTDLTWGFYRRIIILPFQHTIQKSEANPNLTEELLMELPGILNFAIEGLKRLEDNNYKFVIPKASEEIMEKYKEDNNPTKTFFLNNYEYCSGASVLTSSVYDDYVNWCIGAGYTAMNRKAFFAALRISAEETDSQIVLDIKKVKGSRYFRNYRKKQSITVVESSDNTTNNTHRIIRKTSA